MGKKAVSGSFRRQVLRKGTKNVVKTSSWNLGFEALAAARAQFTQFHETPEKVENGYRKCHFWKVQGADFDMFGGAGLILAVIWEACFQRARGGDPVGLVRRAD